MRSPSTTCLGVLLALTLAVSGCDFVEGMFGDGPPKKTAKKQAKEAAEAAPVVSEAKEEKPVEVLGYVYTPIGKRDPFKSYFAMMLPEKGTRQGPIGPLQKFEIGQLSLVAIIWGISNPRAMVETPDKKGYIIKRGTLVGRNWGKVTEIKRDQVVVSEEYRGVDGRRIVNKISMRLPLEKEELRP